MLNNKYPIYGIMIILSLLVNIIVVIIVSKKNAYTSDEIISALIYENIGIIYGANIFSYIQNFRYIKEFNTFKIGLSSYGGLIGAVIFLLIYKFQFKKTSEEIFFTFMPSIPLMYAIGKIGCYISGCCYGIEYDGIGSVTYKYSLDAPHNVPLFPIQIIETFIFTLIYIYIINKILKNKFEWNSLGKSIIFCGTAKFFLDFLRASHNSKILSLNQCLSIIFIIIGVHLCIKNKRILSKTKINEISKNYEYKLEKATTNDIARIKKYKLQTILEHAKNLSNEEITDIKIYVNESLPSIITDYQNIIYNEKVIGSLLIRTIENGFLLDEIYIEKEYRNKKIGSSIIKDFLLKSERNFYLWVYKSNTKAIKLYKSLGFNIIEETKTRYYMEYLKNDNN